MKEMTEESVSRFCYKNELVIMNTTFQQRLRRLLTWVSSDGMTKNQMDYNTLVPQKIENVSTLREDSTRSLFRDRSPLL